MIYNWFQFIINLINKLCCLIDPDTNRIAGTTRRERFTAFLHRGYFTDHRGESAFTLGSETSSPVKILAFNINSKKEINSNKFLSEIS